MAALVIAAAASFSPTAALAATVALAAIIAVVARPAIFPLILVASIFLELVRIEGTTISRVLAPIALVVVLVQLIRVPASIRLAPPLYWVGAYTLWALASGLWTTSVAGTVFMLSSLAIALVYMLSFASLLQTTRDLERVVWVFTVMSLLFGALSLRFVSEGFAFDQGRAQGGVGDPNTFAATQLVALPLAIALAAHVQKRWLQLGLYVTVALIIGSILTSLSRGGFLGLAVLLILLAFVPFRFIFRTRRNKAVILLVVAFALAGMSAVYSSELTERVQATFGETNPAARSGSGRLYLWQAAKLSIQDHPWLGIGYGGFRPASNELLLNTPGVDLGGYPLKEGGQPAHSSYIGSFAELGVVGFVLYVGLLISTGRTLRRAAIQARKAGAFFAGNVAGALLLVLVTWAVISAFLSTETGRAFWIIVGMTLALPRLISSESASKESQSVSA